MVYPKPVLTNDERLSLKRELEPQGWYVGWYETREPIAQWIERMTIPEIYGLIDSLVGWEAVVEYAKYVVYSKEYMKQMLPWIVGGIGVAALVGLKVGKM